MADESDDVVSADLADPHEPSETIGIDSGVEERRSAALSLVTTPINAAVELTGRARTSVTEITHVASAKTRTVVSDIAQSASATAHEIGETAKIASADPTVQKSAIGGATVVGTAATATGALTGAAVGSLVGVPAAIFTFGLSIPTCAAAGAAIGGGTGAGIGGTTGFIGGGTVGYLCRRKELSAAVKEWEDSPDDAFKSCSYPSHIRSDREMALEKETSLSFESSAEAGKDYSLPTDTDRGVYMDQTSDAGCQYSGSEADDSRGLNDSASSSVQEYVDRGTQYNQVLSEGSTCDDPEDALNDLLEAQNSTPPEATASNVRVNRRQRSRLSFMNDIEYQREVAQWVRSVTGLGDDGDFSESLRTGEVLCQLVNKISPGTIPKIERPGQAFRERENISRFLQACRTLGVKEYALFSTDDLYEQHNMNSVMACIHALGSAVQSSVPEFGGPHLGVADRSKLRDIRRHVPPATQTGGLAGAMERKQLLAPRQIIS